MKFSIERDQLARMLKHTKGADDRLRVWACAARVFVEANGVIAGAETVVLENGTCIMPWDTFNKLVKGYKGQRIVTVEADALEFRMEGTTLGHLGYTPTAMPPSRFDVFAVTDTAVATTAVQSMKESLAAMTPPSPPDPPKPEPVPVTPPPVKPPAPSPACVSASAKNVKVLITDDVGIMLIAEKRILEKQGYTVATFEDKAEAIAKWGEFKPDVVMTDLLSPGMDGFGFIRLGRQMDRSVPIIVVSGGSREDMHRARELGALECISKPLDGHGLLAAVERAVAWRKKFAVTPP